MCTHNIHFHDKIRKISLNTCIIELSEGFLKDSKMSFYTAMANQPSVFEFLKFYCKCICFHGEM